MNCFSTGVGSRYSTLGNCSALLRCCEREKWTKFLFGLLDAEIYKMLQSTAGHVNMYGKNIF